MTFWFLWKERLLKEVSQFVSEKLSTLDSVISTATHFILKKYKDHGTILLQKVSQKGCW